MSRPGFCPGRFTSPGNYGRSLSSSFAAVEGEAEVSRILIELGQNVALLLSAALLYGMLVPWLGRRSSATRGAVLGLFFGSVALAGMFLPVNIVQGVHLDGRVIVVTVAAALGGPVSAATAPILPVLYRLHLGGVGSIPGVAALLGGALIGLLFYQRSTRRSVEWTLARRLALGTATAAQALLWTFALPRDTALNALGLYLLPVLVTYPVGCALLVTLLAHQDERYESGARLRQEIAQKERTAASLRESEARFRLLAENIGEVFWMRNAQTDEILYISPAYEKVRGRPAEQLWPAKSSAGTR